MSTTRAILPLQRKVSVTLFLVIAAFALLSFAILRATITPAFDQLELSAAQSDLTRAEMTIRTDIDNLEAVSADWALWDDFYEYLSGRNPEFRDSNLVRSSLTNLGLDLMAVYTTGQELDWSKVVIGDTEHNLGELGILRTDSSEQVRLISHEEKNSVIAGVVATALGPLLISSRPILRSDESGPIAGTLIMGQFLNDARLKRMRERTEVQMHLHSIEKFRELHTAADMHKTPGQSVTQTTSEYLVSSFKAIPDVFGAPAFVLSADFPRAISRLGAQTVNVGLLFLGVAGLVVTFVTWFLLRGTILKPIEKLANHIDKIRESGDLSTNLDLGRGDEIGALALQFDNLTSEVHGVRQALLEQSFKAGKADTAAEVLHNIRNAMTPLINGVDRLSKAFTVSDNLRVAEATAELGDRKCPPDRATKLLQYVEASFQHVEEVGNDAMDELKLVSSQARQIESILCEQERFANVTPVAEEVSINEVVGEAAQVIPRGTRPRVELDIANDLAQFSVRAHRIGVLQVLGNLILNAYESIQRNDTSSGEIALSASGELLDDKAMIRVTIRDDGGGFDHDHCMRIFERGFTSKATGESNGLGLHWCANAVASMGGRIFAESPGKGGGAEFHVLLPSA